jgi:hypothetical protein
MLKPINVSIGIAAATALAQPTLAALPSTQATASQPAANLVSQVVVSFPSAKIKVGTTTVILGKSDSRDRYKEERYERRRRQIEWEARQDREDYYQDRQDRYEDRH